MFSATFPPKRYPLRYPGQGCSQKPQGNCGSQPSNHLIQYQVVWLKPRLAAAFSPRARESVRHTYYPPMLRTAPLGPHCWGYRITAVSGLLGSARCWRLVLGGLPYLAHSPLTFPDKCKWARPRADLLARAVGPFAARLLVYCNSCWALPLPGRGFIVGAARPKLTMPGGAVSRAPREPRAGDESAIQVSQGLSGLAGEVGALPLRTLVLTRADMRLSQASAS